jgi:hypothetical protein
MTFRRCLWGKAVTSERIIREAVTRQPVRADAPASDLRNATRLNLNDTAASDLSFLKNMPRLSDLAACRTMVTDLETVVDADAAQAAYPGGHTCQ